jgi:transcription elongation factor GreB
MSKAFTKEDNDPENDRMDDLPQSPHPNYVTPAGLAALHNRLRIARTALAGLRAKGDDIDSRLQVAVAERDIRFLEGRVNRAILVDSYDHPPGIVAFGAQVEVIEVDDNRHIFRIVGEDEADPANGLITPFSPLAVALQGAVVGDIVDWVKPASVVELEISDVSFP